MAEQILTDTMPTDEEVLNWQEQERADGELDDYYRRVMLPQVRKGIAEMKEEAGAWGLERRLEYLMRVQYQVETVVAVEEYLYQDMHDNNEPYFFRALLSQRLKVWRQRRNKISREMRGIVIKLTQPDAVTENQNGRTDAEIERAREYPLGQLVEVDRSGKARCVNPAHEDLHPSMGIKNNRAYCFSCGFKGDSIDVYRALHGVDFPAAVRALQ